MRNERRKQVFLSVKRCSAKEMVTNLARGSPITAEVALRRLGKLCELLSLNPKQMGF